MKLNKAAALPSLGEDLNSIPKPSELTPVPTKPKTNNDQSKEVKLLDPLCHYNTSLSLAAKHKHTNLKTRLMGGIRKEMILSPYSSIYLKPYIRRDTETNPVWLRLMAEIQMKVNEKNENYILPPRAPIDYTYVQPEHIPAINSLCNNFFWAGIDSKSFLKRNNCL